GPDRGRTTCAARRRVRRLSATRPSWRIPCAGRAARAGRPVPAGRRSARGGRRHVSPVSLFQRGAAVRPAPAGPPGQPPPHRVQPDRERVPGAAGVAGTDELVVQHAVLLLAGAGTERGQRPAGVPTTG